MKEAEDDARRARLLALTAALVSFLPFARGLLAGHSLYFRDLAGYFFPVRKYVARGLLVGELRYWNPLTHEGTPLTLPALGYPLDLLQALWPTEAAMSVLLALHVPLAALGAFTLARRLGMGDLGATGAALAYALGGFSLSSLNLYVYTQALAWAPFAISALLACAEGTMRDSARAALLLALAQSTMGAEIVAQAVAIGLVLAFPRDRRALGRLAVAVLLGAALCAVVTLPATALVSGSARARGFATEVVLAHSVHPITLLQTVVAGLYGDPARLAESFWGQNYFPRGFPYFVSLYAGALGLGLAARGAMEGSRTSRLLVVLALVGMVASLGRYAGLGPVVEALPFVRQFRFPSKVFFTFHLCAALLAGLGIDAARRRPETWRRAGLLLGGLGAAVALLPWLVLLPPGLHRYLVAGFFPPDLAWPAREQAATAIVRDALMGGLLAGGAGLVAIAAGRGHLAGGRAGALIVALLGGDLLRAGAGLNAMVSPAFFDPSAETKQVAEAVQSTGGRLFTFDAGYSSAYYRARAARSDHEAWSFAVLQETLAPSFNLELGVRTALSLDQTMLVAERLTLSPEEAHPSALDQVIGRFREAAVSHILAVEPLAHPDLERLASPSPPRLAPLGTHLYRLRRTWPRIEMLHPRGEARLRNETSGTLEIETACEGPATLVVRDAWASGWAVEVDGEPGTLLLHQGSHRAVDLPSGRHRVVFAYRPPRLSTGLFVSAASALVALALLLPTRRQMPRAAAP